MRILPINSNMQNFKGITIDRGVEYVYAEDCALLTCYNYDYYPFKDDNGGMPSRTVDLKPGELVIGDQYIYNNKEPLNFTLAEYQEYKKSKIGAKSPDEVTHPVEKCLIERKLYCKLNNSEEFIIALKQQKQLARKLKWAKRMDNIKMFFPRMFTKITGNLKKTLKL